MHKNVLSHCSCCTTTFKVDIYSLVQNRVYNRQVAIQTGKLGKPDFSGYSILGQNKIVYCKRRLLDMAFDLEAGSMATIGNLLEGISVWGTLDYKASTALHDVHDVDL